MKFVYSLINPLFPLLLILAFQALRKKCSRRFVVGVFLYLYLITIPLTPKLLARVWAVEDTVDITQKYDAVLVLAGIADSEWYLQRQDKQSPRLSSYYRFEHNADRIVAAADIILTGRADKVLIGDDLNTRPFSEAELLKEFLVEQGIPAGKVVFYGKVRNTADEAVRARGYFEKNGNSNFLLVTSQSHMRRAAAAFRKQGLQPALLSVSKLAERLLAKDFVPTAKALKRVELYCYEFAGYLKYRLQKKV